MNQSLLELLQKTYRLKISDSNYKRLTALLDMYQINPSDVHIELENNKENFINNIHLIKNAKFMRKHTEIELEDVLFQLQPIVFGSSENIDMNYPKRIIHRKIYDAPQAQVMHQNLALIRNLTIRARDDSDPIISERYTLMIFNDRLDVFAGIRFEKN